MGDALFGAAAALGGKRLRDRYASIDPQTFAKSLVRLGSDEAGENWVIEADALRG